jgi:hypothetical protein
MNRRRASGKRGLGKHDGLRAKLAGESIGKLDRAKRC